MYFFLPSSDAVFRCPHNASEHQKYGNTHTNSSVSLLVVQMSSCSCRCTFMLYCLLPFFSFNFTVHTLFCFFVLGKFFIGFIFSAPCSCSITVGQDLRRCWSWRMMQGKPTVNTNKYYSITLFLSHTHKHTYMMPLYTALLA